MTQGYCTEEMKMVQETRKIFNVPDLRSYGDLCAGASPAGPFGGHQSRI